MVTVEKYHGTGNDFLLVDATEDVPDRRAFARRLCDRESGVTHPDSPRTGADGVLFLGHSMDLSPPRVVMTLVQPDGSVAAMCGNGARCAAHWLAARTDATEVMIDTQAGSRLATVSEGVVSVEMGTPTFAPDAVPLAGGTELIEESLSGLTITAVNTGVPHAVAFVEDVDAVDLAAVGPQIRYDERFPAGTNVTVAAPRGDPADEPDGGDAPDGPTAHAGFDQRTYERGVEGETDSCGTGAVAVGAVARRLGTVAWGQTVPVHPPGGRLLVTVFEDGSRLEGPVEREFTTDVSADDPRPVDTTGP